MKYDGLKISKESVDKFFQKTDIDISGYEPPIEIVLGQMRLEQENGIYKAIQEQGIYVDKGELIKALQYDREQYDKGYEDGYNADKWINCHDRLPEDGESVLVWFEHFRYGNPHCPVDSVGIGFYVTTSSRWYVNNTVYKGLQVFAWQPLPTRPTKFVIIKRGETIE